MIPGEILPGPGAVPLNADRPAVTLLVTNTGDRPVQVGSHYHFAQANPALAFDRAAARGRRLDIPAGTAVRFEPGISREVSLVPLGGRRVVPGLRLPTLPADPLITTEPAESGGLTELAGLTEADGRTRPNEPSGQHPERGTDER